MRKSSLPAFLPFPALFSKDNFVRVIKSRDCVKDSELLKSLSVLEGQCRKTLSQMPNFRLFQTERNCRRQFQI